MKFVPAIIIAVISTGCWVMFDLDPGVADVVYGMHIYPVIRRVLDIVFGWLPISFYWPVWIVVVGSAAYFTFKLIRSIFERKGWKRSLRNVFIFLLVVVFSFMWSWGFNYKRPPLKEKAGLLVEPADSGAVFTELSQVIDSMNVIRERVEVISLEVNHLEELVAEVLADWNYRRYGRIMIREIRPKGMMMRFSSAGMFMPFLGEGNIDSGLHPLQKSFTAAHELSHGFGVTGEGECNFVALLACLASDRPSVRYSGWLGYYRYLAGAAWYLSKERYSEMRKKLSKDVVTDLVEIRENGRKYPDIAPKVRELVYDSYLKSQGIKQGTLSYNEVVMLKIAYDRMNQDGH